jgi:hypothetical protein
LIFSGCEWCQRVVKVPYEVKVPVACVIPDAKEPCSTKGKNDVETVIEITRCYFDLKDRAAVCNKDR